MNRFSYAFHVLVHGVPNTARAAPPAPAKPVEPAALADALLPEAAQRLIELRDKVLQAADQPAPANAAAMSSVARQLRQILELEGVVAIEEDGEYDAARQRVIDTVDTADPGQDYQVAASVRPGYRRDGELLRHQDVVLFRCREDSGEEVT